MRVILRLDSTPHRYFNFFFRSLQLDLDMNLCGRDTRDLTTRPKILYGDGKYERYAFYQEPFRNIRK